ncbi:MAG: hypothetical protein IJ774_10005 [Selenomonadaceae bacterium]|nr:hypothetical protein [Selenomonadaceae bacterium]
MARPKKFVNPTTCSFKLETDTLSLLKDFSSACGQDVSDVLLEMVLGLVAANAEMIEDYRAQKSRAVKATFAVPTPPKPARPSKKKKPAAQDSPTSEGDVTNVEN